MLIHDNLKKFIIERVESDLSSKELFPFGRELWVLDFDKKFWYIFIDCDGVFWYNQTFFKVYLDLFSLNKRQFDKTLKSWFEKKFNIQVRKVMRRNSDLNWVLDSMPETKDEKKWTMAERNGFSYETVSRFLGIQRQTQKVLVEDFIYL